MLNALIRFSIHRRGWILYAAAFLLVFGVRSAMRLPMDVLPDLTKPTVTLLTEAPGYAPEEVEMLVSLPLENSLSGIVGVTRVRTVNDAGLSMIQIEFDWGTDVFRARTLVRERLVTVSDELPPGLVPHVAPESSLMGNILLIALTDPAGHMAMDELRVYADVVMARRLQSIPGVAEVIAMGGGVQQLEIQPDPDRMRALGISRSELRKALEQASLNATGGVMIDHSRESMVRLLGTQINPSVIAETVVSSEQGKRVTVGDIAVVLQNTAPMRGDAGVGSRHLGSEDGEGLHSFPGIIVDVTKAPGFDTLSLTQQVETVLEDLRANLPGDVQMLTVYRQADFIGLSIDNLVGALRDGGLLVVVILLLFMGNPRVALIALSAIPLSLGITFIVFDWIGASVNTMTLGGLAVAIGMVVDDAIVDVENTYRRLRENAALPNPLAKADLIYKASLEVRSSILYASVSIMLVFLPLLALGGIEGRLFTPIAVATLLSMAAAFLVSMTLTNALAYVLLNPKAGVAPRDNVIVRGLKRVFDVTWLRWCLAAPLVVVGCCIFVTAWALQVHFSLGDNFLPTFQEPSAVIATTTPPGTALEETTRVAHVINELLLAVPGVETVGFRAGRAEKDDHVVPVSTVEFEVEFDRDSERSRQEILADIRKILKRIPGTFSAVSAPLADRIGHMLSGVADPVAIKIYGPRLGELERLGKELLDIALTIPDLQEARLEPLTPVPQLRIEMDPQRASLFGVSPGEVVGEVGGLLAGETLLEIPLDGRTLALSLRLPPGWRGTIDKLEQLPLEHSGKRLVLLGDVARVAMATGPGVIRRENGNRRLALTAKSSGGDLTGAVEELRRRVDEELVLPPGYTLTYEGDYAARAAATRTIQWTSLFALVLITALMQNYFRSWRLTALVLLNIPVALTGGVLMTRLMLNTASIATMVGYIAVGGIALRNAIMMVSHFLHILRHEDEQFDLIMIRRGALERLSPVLMTALTAGFALLPLVFAQGESGKEILNPVAVVIVGGLISSTFLGLGLTPTLFYHFCRGAAEKSIRLDAPATA